jgi:hypothetical protein
MRVMWNDCDHVWSRSFLNLYILLYSSFIFILFLESLENQMFGARGLWNKFDSKDEFDFYLLINTTIRGLRATTVCSFESPSVIPTPVSYITMPNVVYGMNMLVENVRRIKIPNIRHFIQGEQPQFLVNHLSNFFGQDTTKIEWDVK